MNTKNIVIAGLGILALLAVCLYGSHLVKLGGANPTGQVHYQQEAFPQGAAFGSRNQSYFDSSGVFTSSAANVLSGALSLTSTLKVGSAGTAIAGVNSGTCYIHPYATTVTASSTAQVDCQGTANFAAGPGSALSGVTAADNVVATLGSSTVTSTFGGLRLKSAMGSTTAGYITLLVFNETGTTYTWSITANASGTAQYIATR